MRRINLLLAIRVLLSLLSCTQLYEENETPISFTVSPDGTALIANGIVDDRAPAALQQKLDAHPDVRTLILYWVPGSLDDEFNLETGRIVRTYQLATIVPKNGLVASGGTDLFLAGSNRTISNGACVGVHSWADDENREYGDTTPKGNPVHRLYTDYFDEMGVDPAFYWYTLQAAKPDEMHWMSPKERQKFRISSGRSGSKQSPESTEKIQDRCETRAQKLESEFLGDA